MHRGSELGFGLGFGQAQACGELSGSVEAGGRRQKRKASSEDEAMDSSSPTPEPASRKLRSLEPRRTALDGEDAIAAVINSLSPLARRHGAARAQSSGAYGVHADGAHADGRKRTRVMDAAEPNQVTLDKLLEPLEEKDLRELLEALVGQNPQLGAQVRQLVPRPTVNSACSQLVRLERRLQAAFPYNKAGPAADDYTYSRVKPALEELRDTIVMYLDHFTHYGLVNSSGSSSSAEASVSTALSHPAEWFDLLTQATDVAMRMPKWDSQDHNAIRRETLRQLADGWLRAIMATARWTEEGHIVGRDMLSRWAQQLEHFYSGTGEPSLFDPAVQVFQRSFGHLYARPPSRLLQ
ncbi:Tethering factor for nuclear proteasome sts1 [Coemansia sp. RSA 552]|nr:Tethering factor for nuclear proteasome sts1 [Coemansia sp. RSA 552]